MHLCTENQKIDLIQRLKEYHVKSLKMTLRVQFALLDIFLWKRKEILCRRKRFLVGNVQKKVLIDKEMLNYIGY